MAEFKKISIVIPIYNEEKTLEKIISSVESADTFHLEKEIILVNDCSWDRSKEILEKHKEKHKVHHHEKNQGKGAALKTGFQNATGDIVIIQDADLEYDPDEYKNMLKPILDGKADVVYGSRFLGTPRRVLMFWHTLGNKLLTFLSNLCTNLNLTDMETGYKVFKKEVLDHIHLKSNRFGFEPEVTAKIAKMNYRIYEVPISYSGRDYAEGKKIGWKDGLAALFHIIRFRFFN